MTIKIVVADYEDLKYANPIYPHMTIKFVLADYDKSLHAHI